MSTQANDIANEALAGLDALMHESVQVFREIARAMLTPQPSIRARRKPSAAVQLFPTF